MAVHDLTPESIAKALGSPLDNVKANWPLLKEHLANGGVKSDAGLLMALATIACEAKSFAPVIESFWLSKEARDKYHFKNYDPNGSRPHVAKQLGNILTGDGARFCGRGYIQTTGRANYKALTPVLGIDMEKNPDELLKPVPASKAMAFYMVGHGCVTWADKAMHSTVHPCEFCPGNGLMKVGVKNGKATFRRPKVTERVCQECCWKTARRTVNGGLNGYKEFKSAVNNLLKLL